MNNNERGGGCVGPFYFLGRDSRLRSHGFDVSHGSTHSTSLSSSSSSKTTWRGVEYHHTHHQGGGGRWFSQDGEFTLCVCTTTTCPYIDWFPFFVVVVLSMLLLFFFMIPFYIDGSSYRKGTCPNRPPFFFLNSEKGGGVNNKILEKKWQSFFLMRLFTRSIKYLF